MTIQINDVIYRKIYLIIIKYYIIVVQHIFFFDSPLYFAIEKQNKYRMYNIYSNILFSQTFPTCLHTNPHQQFKSITKHLYLTPPTKKKKIQIRLRILKTLHDDQWNINNTFNLLPHGHTQRQRHLHWIYNKKITVMDKYMSTIIQ